MSELNENGGAAPVENPASETAQNEKVAIKETEAPKRPRHVLRRVLIALLVCLLIFLTVLLASPRCRVAALGLTRLGKPYVFAEAGPDSYDCSGLTSATFRDAAGIELKRTADKQGYDDSYTKLEKPDELRLGDLVFFDTVRDRDKCDHVGICLGFGYFLHASSKQGKVVISNLSEEYYSKAFTWGRRILP